MTVHNIDREDYRFTSDDSLYSTTINSQVSAPDNKDGALGKKVNDADKKGCRYLSLSGEIRNSADDAFATTNKIRVWLWFWFPLARSGEGMWKRVRSLTFYLQSEIDADTDNLLGNVYSIAKPADATRVYVETDANPAAENVLHLDVARDT